MPPALGTAEKPSAPAITTPTRAVKTLASTTPRIMPMTPPMAEVVPASMINWLRISRPLAPRDLRMPISRVRSVTDTSMMFIMPMPPTTREMAAMTTRMVMSTPSMESIMSIISAEVMTM